MTGAASDSDSGRILFPEFWEVGGMIHSELEGMSDEQLDWSSDEWEWAAWSVRRQTSHMASMLYRWLLIRWGGQLFPNGHGLAPDQVTALANSSTDRALDEKLFHEIGDVTRALDNAMSLARAALESHTVGQMRSMNIDQHQGSHWDLMIDAHPTGIVRDQSTGMSNLTLEGTFRHMYFELITHLFNIQRLKRAQGIEAVVDLPRVGYWTLPGWDISEA